MADDPTLALQKAMVAALVGNTGAGASVFDRVPPPLPGPFPRVIVGPAQAVAEFADCMDGTESFLQVDIWSREVGFPQVKAIAGDVRRVLDGADLVLEGHVLDLFQFRDAQYLNDPDGLTRHVVMVFRAESRPDGSD